MYLILELLAYDEANTLEYVLGEKQYSVFSLVQQQLIDEKEAILRLQAIQAGKSVNPTTGGPAKPQEKQQLMSG